MNEAPGKWTRLKSLTAWQWRVILTYPFVLLLTGYRLRSKGYVGGLESITVPAPERMAAADVPGQARETAYACAVAVKYGPWRPRCLLRSMALGWFLARRGVPFEIRLGVPVEKGAQPDFEAHAWVEAGGEALNEQEGLHGRYRAFDKGSRGESAQAAGEERLHRRQGSASATPLRGRDGIGDDE